MPQDEMPQLTAGMESTAPPSSQLAPRAAYIHVPFCAHRCGYCNFTVVANRQDLIPAYLDALATELACISGSHEVDTLFFGGGTPSQLALKPMEQLFSIVREAFPLASDGELSVEVNPVDLTPEKAKLLATAGVTRISLGAQSFNAGVLRTLERDHTGDDIRRAVNLARTFARSVSLDLIFATPDQTIGAWERELAAVLELEPDHVSTYGLTYERGTSFWSRLNKSELNEINEETQRQMYLLAIERLAAGGLEHYEISNFARSGHRCRHNEGYWSGDEYFAAGPGAARHIAGERSTNHRSTLTWIKRLRAGQSPITERETLLAHDKARETLVLGLRRIEGIDQREFQRKTGFTASELLGNSLNQWLRLRLVVFDGGRIRLTRNGMLLSDQMWSEVLRI
ncbi:MAG: radical SAM family heme chaperone HemW [Pirellulales bacterium]|nr:radical SAM family heme chaperone HemW [Pirellulales bacterium]